MSSKRQQKKARQRSRQGVSPDAVRFVPPERWVSERPLDPEEIMRAPVYVEQQQGS